MKPKEYLSQLKLLDTEIKQKLDELSELRELSQTISGIDYTKDKVLTSKTAEAAFVRTVDRIVDLSAEIDKELDCFIAERHKIINGIQNNQWDTKYQRC